MGRKKRCLILSSSPSFSLSFFFSCSFSNLFHDRPTTTNYQSVIYGRSFCFENKKEEVAAPLNSDCGYFWVIWELFHSARFLGCHFIVADQLAHFLQCWPLQLPSWFCSSVMSSLLRPIKNLNLNLSLNLHNLCLLLSFFPSVASHANFPTH